MSLEIVLYALVALLLIPLAAISWLLAFALYHDLRGDK